ncbi:MAG: hypothetical protein J7K77_03755 [Dehalococcoidales bacterium]|nr:hypothetical protein [Dehalococcoidales bacterium]
MQEIGLVTPYWLVVGMWVGRIVLMVVICTLLGWLGIRVLDALTPHIQEREQIGKNPVSTGLFIAGFFILVGLVIHGAATAHTAFGGSAVSFIFDFRTWGLVAISFAISLLIGIALLRIVDKLTPKIPFLKVNESPVAVGVYVFGYLIFFGLILHAALTTPL